MSEGSESCTGIPPPSCRAAARVAASYRTRPKAMWVASHHPQTLAGEKKQGAAGSRMMLPFLGLLTHVNDELALRALTRSLTCNSKTLSLQCRLHRRYLALIAYWHRAGDVSTKIEADCQKAGGMWDSKMDMCMEKKQ